MVLHVPLSGSRVSGVWLVADLHINHIRCATEWRPFGTVEEHDATIIKHWRRMVKPEDIIWVLGDISSGTTTAQEHALAVLADLPGEKCLVAGNHDSVSPVHGGNSMRKWMPAYREVFSVVCSHTFLKVEGVRLHLSHYPFDHDRGEVRYREYRVRDEGQWLAHGHTHATEMWVPERPREICVSVDALKWRPVSLGTIGKFIREKITADML